MISKKLTIPQRIKKIINTTIFETQFLLTKPTYGGKVFCIGYNKTGTTTVGEAFKLLGLHNSSFNKKVWRKYYKEGNFYQILRYTARFDSFDDLPWLKEDMIPLLDKVFPGSKFVFLERGEEEWLRSYKNWTFKVKGFHPDLEEGLKAFKAHRAFVLDYFSKRQKDFLILNISDEKAFEKLGLFLDRKPPHAKLPHYNKT